MEVEDILRSSRPQSLCGPGLGKLLLQNAVAEMRTQFEARYLSASGHRGGDADSRALQLRALSWLCRWSRLLEALGPCFLEPSRLSLGVSLLDFALEAGANIAARESLLRLMEADLLRALGLNPCHYALHTQLLLLQVRSGKVRSAPLT